MKPLVLSLVLILAVSSAALSQPSPKADESVKPDAGKSNQQSQQPTPSTGVLRGPEKPQPNKKNSQSQPSERGTEEAPFVIKIQPSQKTEEVTHKPERHHEIEAPTVYGLKTEAWIAIGTIVQAVVLFLTLLVVMRTAYRQLRAYVFVHHIAPVPSPKSRGKPGNYDVRIEIKNSGKTPAYRVSCLAIASQQQAPPVPFNDHALMHQLIPARLDLGPGGTIKVMIRDVYGGYQRTSLLAQGMVIYISGEIRYRHSFSWWWTPDRTTHFRYIWRPGPNDTLETALEGNRAD